MKKAIAVLLALVLMFGAALPAFAFPMTEEGEDETFGIAKGYVRTKEVQKNSDGSSISSRAVAVLPLSVCSIQFSSLYCSR